MLISRPLACGRNEWQYEVSILWRMIARESDMPLDGLPQFPQVATTPTLKLPFWQIQSTDAPERKAFKFAYGLICHKKNWCYGTAARTDRGRAAGVDYVYATRFCAYGALLRAEQELDLPRGTALRAIKTHGLTYSGLLNVNDWLGWRAVRWLMKRAILRG